MKFYLIPLLSAFLVLVNSCSTGQSKQGSFELSPADFAKKLKAQPNALLLDVRSPGEFARGALPNAKNIDWNGPDFEWATSEFSKADPVFVYCLSGGRSASAAAQMRSLGFTKVYEMEGGLMKWRAEGIPMDNTSTPSAKKNGMQKAEFEVLLNSDKTILVDFYADWYWPCKKMKPDQDRLAEDQKERITIIRIDADANPELAKQLRVNALPTLVVYRNKKELKRKEGFQSGSQMEEKVKQSFFE